MIAPGNPDFQILNFNSTHSGVSFVCHKFSLFYSVSACLTASPYPSFPTGTILAILKEIESLSCFLTTELMNFRNE